MISPGNLFSLATLLWVLCSGVHAFSLEPEIKKTCLNTHFQVRPVWKQNIDALVSSLRFRITEAHNEGKTVVYISLPLSAHNGGIRAFNEYLGVLMEQELIRQNPEISLEIILPGQEGTELDTVYDLPPNGGEYLYMWTQVLAGKDCIGDIQWVYFMDRHDVKHLLKLDEFNPKMSLTYLLETFSVSQPDIYSETFHTPELREAFLDYYLKQYSAFNSKGARDEWNIVQQLNRKKSPSYRIWQHSERRWFQETQPMTSPGYQLSNESEPSE